MDEPADFDFDLDRSTEQAWAQFTERLAEVVSVIDDNGSLTIGTPSLRDEMVPYVRFVQIDPDDPRDDARIVLQASSNAHLGPSSQLTQPQVEEMTCLGWQLPDEEELPNDGRLNRTGNPAHEEVLAHGDFWVLSSQNDCYDVAELAVTTLRTIFSVQHPVFLAPDQLAEVLQPQDDSELDGPVLAQQVADELTTMFGHPPFRDEEGDFAIRVGSTMVFIRATSDGEELLLFSVIVHDVDGRSRAVEVLNDLNVQSRYGRFALHQDRVLVTMSLMAKPFVPEHLHRAVRIMSQLSDGIDDELARKLHGRTTFDRDTEDWT